MESINSHSQYASDCMSRLSPILGESEDRESALNFLLETTAQVSPQMRDALTNDLLKYFQRYGVEAVINRQFYNLGGGKFWHPAWQNVDYYSEHYKANSRFINVHQDFSLCETYPVGSASACLVYTSHTIEHLLDEHVAHMFAEAYRILKPGGRIRVTCPNIDLYIRAYLNNDVFVFGDESHCAGRSLENLLLHEFASQLSVPKGQPSPTGLSDLELAELFRQSNIEQSYETIAQMCDFQKQQASPGDHINWWNHAKVSRFLESAGFDGVTFSGYGQSYEVALRHTAWFDRSLPDISLYMEASKPAHLDH
jgi:SAM-dependent methyltransferase